MPKLRSIVYLSVFKLVILLEGACGANMDSIEHHRIRQDEDGLGHTLCGLDFFGHGISKSRRISFPQENVKIVERGEAGWLPGWGQR